MTEAEWLACDDPWVSARQGRHAQTKVFRHCLLPQDLPPFAADEGCLAAFRIAESFTEGAATEEELATATHLVDAGQSAAFAATDSSVGSDFHAVAATSHAALAAVAAAAKGDTWASPEEAPESEKQAHAQLLRCIFGNAFRPVALDPAWLAWTDGTVPKLAAAIYDARRFGDLPILADALEDAGCTDAAILAHCRESGEHVRGCWVVDLILGKS